MNDDKQDESLNAECSLCWKCKFGVCVKESETERIQHINMRGMGMPPGMMPPPQQGVEGFGLFEDAPFTEGDEVGGDEDGPELIEHTVEHERIKTICYWRPAGIENSPPILVSKVDQCNRFEEK
ncbi:MAG: hypothetical protein K5880_14480 [Hydrogenophaga sp.]|uniref:hypothetical protein n=1 Tax=Hydrogenophaga sp. TaxID=1904254 RepID=UPI0026102DF5|nr:hypothetical protein [Hydrogenophaga sp.]MCV0439831.1 hypothetical protein [Hydrogenophaga sp.]